MKKFAFPVTFIIFFVTASYCFAEQQILAMHVATPPVIDGRADDIAWKNVEGIITNDKVGKLDITLKAVYTDQEIFFLVSFPDPDESRDHKSWNWDKNRKIYTVGHDREDIFVIKWNMEAEPADLSIFAENPSLADIWYWKAHRTDMAGYADDKIHILSDSEMEDATRIASVSGKPMYLLRRGDEGRSAYRVKLTTEFQGVVLPRYITRQPMGSRSDVQAKGAWQNGIWTIELRRKLVTGYQDDIQFNTDGKYLFGISRYEIAGRRKNSKLSEPLYGSGDINEPLWLVFSKK